MKPSNMLLLFNQSIDSADSQGMQGLLQNGLLFFFFFFWLLVIAAALLSSIRQTIITHTIPHCPGESKQSNIKLYSERTSRSKAMSNVNTI